jgi:hypothetical protein
VIAEAWFFYDDEDACTSFASATARFDPKLWVKTEMPDYVVFCSTRGNKVKVYMNKPDSRLGSEFAQQAMLHAIRQGGEEVTVYIHRGHSYHVYLSLQKMDSAAQLVFLGSCGGYSEMLKIFQLNPDMNLIVSRHIGSKLINDQLLEFITKEMVSNRDINWKALWKKFETKLQTKQERELFASYIPPNEYIGIRFLRRVFNY